MIYKIVGGTPVPADLRTDFPNTSFPADLSRATLPEGYIWVWPVARPVCGQFEHVESALPALVGDTWIQQWLIVPWTPGEMQRFFIDKIQQHLDDTARVRGYDGILSLCTYATSPSLQFSAEGQAGVEWRDACWQKGYEILAECVGGRREIPTPAELIAELPEMVWP